MLRSRTVPPLEARLQENSLKHMTTRTRLRPPEERVSPLQLAVTTALDDMKAVNVRVLDVRELTDVFDTMVIASGETRDRKSTRLNSSHSQISYAVFCLKKKK